MVTLNECMDLTGLEVEEIDAIAEHERVPQIVAAEIGPFPSGNGGWPASDPEHDLRRDGTRASIGQPASRR